MSHTKAHTQKIQAIPAAKRTKKNWSILYGFVVAGTGFALPRLAPQFPIWFAMAVVGFGAWIASGEMLRGYLGYIPAAIKDILAAVKGK